MKNTARTARHTLVAEDIRCVGSELHWYLNGVFIDVLEYLPLTSGTQLNRWTR